MRPQYRIDIENRSPVIVHSDLDATKDVASGILSSSFSDFRLVDGDDGIIRIELLTSENSWRSIGTITNVSNGGAK